MKPLEDSDHPIRMHTTTTCEPVEWLALFERVATLPETARDHLQPVLDAAMEHARFRQRIVELAREAVEQSRLERLLLEFDLEATRREHEELRRQLEAVDRYPSGP